MKNLTSKKAQVQIIAPAILSLVFAAVVLVFGLIITQELRDSNVIDQAVAVTVGNESVTSVTETAQNLATVGDRGANSFAAITYGLTNGTLAVINAANFTFTSAGALSFASTSAADAAQYNNSAINISYSYLHGDEAYVGANLTVVGLGTFADFWEIIVLAIIITVVIGLLLTVFGGRRSR